jgi:hypothetical protein
MWRTHVVPTGVRDTGGAREARTDEGFPDGHEVTWDNGSHKYIEVS